jgi:tetratricopeptide (TPR) repeat protein
MRYWALLAISLVLIAGISPARQDRQAPTGTATTGPAQDAAGKPSLTPREIAEMRADILAARKEFAAAAAAYEEILRDEKKNAVLLNKIGMAYQQLGDARRAERYYKKAVHADKHFSSAINNLGTLEYGKGNYRKAIKYYKKALRLAKDQPAFYSNLGYAYCGSKEYAQAIQAFSRALALDPEIFEHRGGLGPIVQQRSTPPDPGVLHFLVAKSYALTGDAEHTALYLKMARDDGYKKFLSAKTDPAFAKVIKDARVQAVLRVRPPFATEENNPTPD